MQTARHISSPDGVFELRIGPLHYRFEAGDAWGDAHLQALADHLQATTAPGNPDRIVNLAGTAQTEPADSWQHNRTPLGSIAWRADAPAATWTATASPDLPPFRFQLPWALLIADIARRGGAVIHAGLAVRQRRALLFLAPPGGGKSTTLATVPADWEVLSDDACLVWPEHGGWLASPLPSWSMMTAAGPAPGHGRRCDPGRQRPLCGLLILAKEPALRLEPVAPVAAAPHLFRAASEYPATVLVDLPLQEHYFRTACAVARALPGWRLALSLGADPWPLLAGLTDLQP